MLRQLVFLCCVAVLGFATAPAWADGDKIKLDGLWFTCEFAHSKIPPPDKCETLDDDGFLVEGDFAWHMKVQNGDREGCRGDRAGNCFKRDRKSIVVKKRKIGEAVRTDKGAIIEYLWCGQPYAITHGPDYSEVRPIEPMCTWTSKKTYYVSRWTGDVEVMK